MKLYSYSLLMPPLISGQLFCASLKGVGQLLQFPRTWPSCVGLSPVIQHHGDLLLLSGKICPFQSPVPYKNASVILAPYFSVTKDHSWREENQPKQPCPLSLLRHVSYTFFFPVLVSTVWFDTLKTQTQERTELQGCLL